MADWVAGIPRDTSIYAAGGGSYNGGPYKIVLHSTEGGWDGSMSVFRSRMTAPHFMADPATKRIVQMVPLNRSAYALQNQSGGVETNRDGAIQVEIVGYAGRMHELSDDQLEWLGVKVVRMIVDNAPGPIRYTAPRFYGEDAGFTLASSSARQRMSYAEWDAFNGVCGHQHVPENSHWDPGKLNIDKVLRYAEDRAVVLNDQQKRNILAAARRMIRENPRPNLRAKNPPFRGRYVREVQGALDVPVTGKYGPGTRDAVKELQRIMGLDVTGEVDQATWVWVIYFAMVKAFEG